jgi:hypothetical protein
MNVGYYPIKDTEIKEIMKMVVFQNKNNKESIEKILVRNNVDSDLKDEIYNYIAEGAENKERQSFNEAFGICLAKVQKIYRDSFNFKDKSLTDFIKAYPILEKYKDDLSKIVKFKNNKYEFWNELKIPNSCGIYISFENLEKIYKEYYLNVNIKKAIDSFYGIPKQGESNVFMEVLDYCIKNECGLLEADYIREDSKNILQSKKEVVEEPIIKTTENVEETEENEDDRQIVGVINKTFSIFGYRFLWEIIAALLLAIISVFFTSKIDSVPIKLAISVTVSIIINIIIWKETIKSSFKKRIIAKEKVNKLMVNITIIVSIFVAINVVSNYFTYLYTIKTFDSSNVKIKYYTMMIENFGTDEEKQEYKKTIEDLKKQARKELLPYYLGSSISTIIINLGVLPYVKKKIEKAIE